MKEMNEEKLPVKSRIIHGLISGTIYAVIMAIFDYFSGKDFSFPKYLFHMIFFGLVMTIIFNKKYIRKEK